jgi:hypothetical protein
VELNVEAKHRTARPVEDAVVRLGIPAAVVFELEFLCAEHLPVESLEGSFGETREEELSETLASFAK